MVVFSEEEGTYEFNMGLGHTATFETMKQALTAYVDYHDLLKIYGPWDALRGPHMSLIEECREVIEKTEKKRGADSIDVPPEGCIYIHNNRRKNKPRGDRARIFGSYGPVFKVNWKLPNPDGTWRVSFTVEANVFMSYLERFSDNLHEDANIVHTQGPYILSRQRVGDSLYTYHVSNGKEYLEPDPDVDPFVKNVGSKSPLMALCIYHRVVSGQVIDTHPSQHQKTA